MVPTYRSLQSRLSHSYSGHMSEHIHYAKSIDIRMKAGFEKATNLSDRYVWAARRAAQSEIDAALQHRYSVPFNPVPEKIRTLTIKIAAYTLKNDAYGDVGSQKALEALRKQLQALADGEVTLVDENGNDLDQGEGVTGSFGNEPRMFSVGQRF